MRGSSSLSSTAANAALAVIAEVEPAVAAAIRQELADQRESLKLIASENYASPAVLFAMGNWLSDKYAEGTIGRRFYAGCQNVDDIEQLAANQAKALFGSAHAYVQPHSGIDANLVAFWSILAARVEAPALATADVRHVNDLSDDAWRTLRTAFGTQRLLGMSLDAGGHLTHGFRPNISGKMFDQASYGTNPATGLLDYEALRKQAHEFRPLILLAGYSAYPRLVDFQRMREIADEVGAVLMVDMAHFAGLVAGKVLTGVHDPVPFADVVTTTTHKSLRGPRGGMVLCTDEYAVHVDRGCPMVLGGPLPHIMAAKAVALAEARTEQFQQYAQRVVDNAKALADGLLRRGTTLVTGGTDNHLLLIDTRTFGLTGRQAEAALIEAGIVANRNTVPNDPNGPWYTSGVRMGSPALTTRGLGTAEMDVVARLTVEVLRATKAGQDSSGARSKVKYQLEPARAEKVRQETLELLSDFPLYGEIELESSSVLSSASSLRDGTVR